MATKQHWTEAQRQAIREDGRSLLVSAAAGSGKTSVLAERCVRLVCDGPDPCSVDQLLVVTFTESAAAEMKSRIHEELRRRLREDYSDRLARQVALVEHAQVSTIHSFCNRLLRRHFNLAGLDPEFDVLDGDEAVLVKFEVAGEMFERRYDAGGAGAFQNLIDAYGEGQDERLIARVVSAHDLLCSLRDPDGWLDRAASAIAEGADRPIAQSALGRKLIDRIERALLDLTGRCAAAAASIGSMGQAFKGYLAHLGELSAVRQRWSLAMRKGGLDALRREYLEFAEFKPRMPSIPGDTPGKEVAKSEVDAVKEAMTGPKSPLGALLASDEAQWREGLRLVAPHAGEFLGLVRQFGEDYGRAKSAQRALDFADLERLSLGILNASAPAEPAVPSGVARSLQRQFRHVLVDEYQDINEIQDAILTLVSRDGEASAGSANQFCVGDVKQSIFRFRLAEPRRFLDRLARFESPNQRAGKVIHLQENFRSRGPLLEAINVVFDRLMTKESAQIDYAAHRLVAGLKYPSDGGRPCFTGAPIQLHLLPMLEMDGDEGSPDMERSDYEAALVAREIQRMVAGMDTSPPRWVCKPVGAGELVPQPIRYSDIVILLRSAQFKADSFADALRKLGIPAHSDKGTGFFAAQEIRDVLSLLEVLDNRRQDIPLAAVLRSPLLQLPNPDDALARIRLAFGAEDVPFHEAVRRYADERRDELAGRLREALRQLDDWRDQANKRPVAELLRDLYERTGYLAYCSGLADGEQRVANLLALADRAVQFGTFLRQGLHRFLHFLQELREHDDPSRATLAASSDDVVRIMTIHRAKGLEFPVVFLPDLGKKINRQDTAGAIVLDRQEGLGMDVIDPVGMIRYPSLASTVVSASLDEAVMAEELRLLYVAMTRAREQLILVGTCKAGKMEQWRNHWGGFRGPMPAEAVLRAATMLDWLGPVAAMTEGAAAPVLQVIPCDSAGMDAWVQPSTLRGDAEERLQHLARLEPLDPAAPADATAGRVTWRFDHPYRFDEQTRRAAAAAVTELAKRPAADEEVVHPPPERKLDLPGFFAPAKPKPTDIGIATHLVLEHWDFSRGPESVQQQIAELLDRKLIARQQAEWVNHQAVAWLLNSELGGELRVCHDRLLREVPFALAEGDEGLDGVMVRGRIDLLLPTADGWAIVDYKTDDVSGPDIDRRVESYERQMDYYRRAVRLTGRPVSAIHLVFLIPRCIRTV